MAAEVTARVVVVSDTHLSARAPEALANWAAAARHVATIAPLVVIHAGDVTLDGAADPSELAAAKQLLDELGLPWLAVPGNHDVGDNPPDGVTDTSSVSDDRLRAWRATLGDDRWRADVAGWTVLGCNAQLFGARSAEEEAQWRWLSGALADAGADREIIANALDLDGRRHLWAPTTWAVLPDGPRPAVGVKRSGILEVDLRPDGNLDWRAVEVPQLRQLTLGRDVAVPW